jgi:hypothetical protein
MFKTEADAREHIAGLCQAEHLDPDNDPYVPIYNEKKQGWLIYPKVATLEVKAMRNGSYAGKNKCIFFYNENTELLFAQTTIFRLIMDQPRAFESDPVFLSEYANANIKWHHEKKHMFLAKVALGRALRHAFPDLFGVVITYEEAMCKLEFDSQSATMTNKNKVESNKPSIPAVKSIADTVAEVFKS